jgi:hypothetical protein
MLPLPVKLSRRFRRESDPEDKGFLVRRRLQQGEDIFILPAREGPRPSPIETDPSSRASRLPRLGNRTRFDTALHQTKAVPLISLDESVHFSNAQHHRGLLAYTLAAAQSGLFHHSLCSADPSALFFAPTSDSRMRDAPQIKKHLMKLADPR